MSERFRVGIMGCGPGGIYLCRLLRQRKPWLEIAVFDKRQTGRTPEPTGSRYCRNMVKEARLVAKVAAGKEPGIRDFLLPRRAFSNVGVKPTLGQIAWAAARLKK